ncbi:hypothetical protein ACOY5X_22635 [Enterobacter kobei]|uniref:hypothetical protein n=1 Tax=Enterobacter kobei TaxID=208224 RepID=UPI003BEF3163
MSVGVMGVAFYLVQRLHDAPLLWLLVLPVVALVVPGLPFWRLLRRRLRHAGGREVLRQSARLWGPPVLLMGCGVGLVMYPGSDRSVSGSGAGLNVPDTRCERPERSGVLLAVACPDAGQGIKGRQADTPDNDNDE